MAQVIRPVIPYKGPIYEGIQEGKQIKITGCVPYKADKFTVSLMHGLDTESDDRPLHLSIRFKLNTVVRNIYHRKSWDREEREGYFPFTKGKRFTMVIVVERAAYQIFVNGRHCWNFAHRLPFTRARSIYIKGDVTIERIEFINKVTSQAVCLPSAPPDINFDSLFYGEQVFPCVFPIHGGITPGMSIYITGRPTSNPYRFTINIQKGASTSPPPDVALQFDVCFYNYSIIRNCRLNGVWHCEENIISYFPFQPGCSFEMEIKVHCDVYVIMVNGQHFVSFRHRLTTFPEFNVLCIQNDVIVNSVRYN